MGRDAKHIDRRILRSRKAIIQAFERLLVDNDLSRITVSAIAREANVDRKTFYVHFGTIDGLLDAVAEDIVADVLNEVDARVGALDEELRPAATPGMFFDILNEVISCNLVLNRRFFESVSTEVLLERIQRPFAEMVVERGLTPDGMSREALEYRVAFMLGGIISVYRRWILSDGEFPVEEVSRAACELTRHGLSGM